MQKLHLPSVYHHTDGAVYEIDRRLPYNIRGQATFVNSVLPQSFPDGAFVNNSEHPFEVMRMGYGMTLVGLAATLTPALQNNNTLLTLAQFFQITVRETKLDEPLMKEFTRLSDLVNRQSLSWEFAGPYTMEYEHYFDVEVINTAPGSFASGDVGGILSVDVANIELELNFQGSLLVLGRKVG